LTYIDEAQHSYSIPGPLDTSDIFKVMRSQVRVVQ